ncbi:hypothetical conserved protein (plasmid) [Rhizobium etli CIAT 652]|uniref:Hypothetical conserved protein n=1 Tax=Rhizobium etli (strain CIAT 652) TaxID=491916 RepID=B3Q1V8_RHIE6|nr:hypothetical conserved protein [Rhizobium etli CIAT 652]
MNVARSFNNWRKYRQTVAELGRMTTRELDDLGIGRGEISLHRPCSHRPLTARQTTIFEPCPAPASPERALCFCGVCQP